MTTKRVALLTTLTLVLVGCGTLFNGKTSTISMSSNPVGAEVIVDGDRMGTTPISLDLSVKEEHRVVFRMDGYDEVTCILNRKVGTGWVILDILGGVIPIIIDAATGSWYELSENACNVTLPRANQAKISELIQKSYGGRL